MVGVFDKKGNANGAYLTLIFGTILGIFIFILQQLGIWNIHFTINAGIVVALSAVVFILSSRMSAPPTTKVIEDFTFQKHDIPITNAQIVDRIEMPKSFVFITLYRLLKSIMTTYEWILVGSFLILIKSIHFSGMRFGLTRGKMYKMTSAVLISFLLNLRVAD